MGSAEVNGKLWGLRAAEWAELQERTASPLYTQVFSVTKLGKGSRYLDVGCGSGMALEFAARLGAVVNGLDASPDLVEVARQRVTGGAIRVGELEQLPFADGSYDLVTGYNAFQYAASPLRAIREAARVTRAGGHVVIATWSPPELTEASRLIAALRPLMPTPPPNAPGPFALSDAATLSRLAIEAGLRPVDTADVDSPFAYADIATAIRALNSSGVAARAIAHSGEEAVSRAHEAALREFARDDGTIFVPNRFRYLLTEVG